MAGGLTDCARVGTGDAEVGTGDAEVGTGDADKTVRTLETIKSTKGSAKSAVS